MPLRSSASTPTRMKPAWAIDEYASIRFTSDWTIAMIEPTAIVMIATAQRMGDQSHRASGTATYATRNSAPNAATFVQAAMKPVTGVGAPWYTSGVQTW